MKKNILITFILFFFAATAVQAESRKLQVYLPRNIQIENSTPVLGDIVILNGSAEFVEKAEKIPMGTVALADQQLVVDRPTILSRLAANDITASNVKFTGAQSVSVSQKNLLVGQEQIIKSAENFIKQIADKYSIANWSVIREPDDFLTVEKKTNISLQPVLREIINPNIIKIAVNILSDTQALDTKTVEFRVKFIVNRAVASADIQAGQVLTKDNIVIEKTEFDKRQKVGWQMPYGLSARHHITIGTVISENMVIAPEPEVLVKRNDSIVIKIDNKTLTVSTMGKALQDGVEGEYIKVQNSDSKRIFLAKVNKDGSVEPAL